ncbi:hypothetical protein BU15DRAFT_66117 [Melanogaster broomeanus]|nr:hypothetical protein BU15DRAFT_66117 [Melanogaster broomeanus]
MPQKPETMRQVANDVATDAITPNTIGAELTKPTGTSHELRNEPRKSTGSYLGSRGENDDSRGPGAHCMQGPGEGAMDQPIDGISPAPRASSPPATTINATATPPSMPLEGECDAQRHMNGARTSHLHGAIAHGEGPSAWAEHCTSRDSNRVETGPLAEAIVRQDRWYMHKPHDDVPEPCTPPTRHPKRPIESANPPRRRGRLKLRPTRVHRARAYEEMRTRSRRDHPRQIGSDRMHRISTRDAGGAS